MSYSFKKVGGITVGVVALAALLITLGMPNLSYAGSKKSVKTACPASWTPVFDGSVDINQNPDLNAREYPMAVNQFTNAQKVRFLLENGCEFRVVQTVANGGGSSSHAYTCEKTSIYGDGTFTCLTSKQSITGEEDNAFYSGTKVIFKNNGRTAYIPMDTEPDPVDLSVSIYARQ